MATKPTWANRIVGHAELAAGDIVKHPKNWRLHPDFQSDALAGSLDELGWIDEVTINQATGLVIDGHLRVTLAMARSKAELVPVRYVDLTPAQESLALATKDPIAGLALADDQKLTDLLLEVETDDPSLQQLLDEMAIDSEMLTAIAGDRPEVPRDAKWNQRQVKVVLNMDQLAVFEAAIELAGIANRGQALADVCEAFINGSTEGQ